MPMVRMPFWRELRLRLFFLEVDADREGVRAVAGGELPLLDGVDGGCCEQLVSLLDSALMTLPEASTVVVTTTVPVMPIWRRWGINGRTLWTAALSCAYSRVTARARKARARSGGVLGRVVMER